MQVIGYDPDASDEEKQARTIGLDWDMTWRLVPWTSGPSATRSSYAQRSDCRPERKVGSMLPCMVRQGGVEEGRG